VIPKGNLSAGADPHRAAAAEAEEEAGVIGVVCPTPLGSYRYRKRRGSGASLMADVEVFPLQVSRELDDWEEKEQRQRRWFSLTEAADKVEEEDLRDLIRSFGATEFNKAARRTGMLSYVAEKSRVGLRTVRSPCGGPGRRRRCDRQVVPGRRESRRAHPRNLRARA
jgi:ADP-ribose pyrophosphatase YjhB (NUDIX family)